MIVLIAEMFQQAGLNLSRTMKENKCAIKWIPKKKNSQKFEVSNENFVLTEATNWGCS